MKQPTPKLRTVRRRRTQRQIAKIFRAHQRSGLSLLAFARKQGLCYSSLIRWRARERNRGTALEISDLGADPQFVPVKIEPEGLIGDYVLSWPTGWSLKIPLQFETDSLRRLLSVLEAVR